MPVQFVTRTCISLKTRNSEVTPLV